ncbi:MAG TPA: sirohydrochlorin chelatase [Sporichthyaceae bacterium]|nr:sirohydrochlorin chelatase [Sporichthyaceae bacterium]
MSAATLIAVAHGSRSPEPQENVRRLLDAVRAARPGLNVREAYIELAEPSVPDVLRSLAGRAVVVPLLLGNGYHIAHDVAGVAAAHRDGLPCAPALGPSDLLIDALVDRLAVAEAGSKPEGPVVLAAAGSSDPRAQADVETMAGRLAARLRRPVVPAYNTSARPGVAETVVRLRAAGHTSISIASYLLWPGRFAAEVAEAGADFVAGPIGVQPALAELVLARYDAACLTSAAALTA